MNSGIDSVQYWRFSAFYFCFFAILGAIAPFWPLYLKEQGFTPLEIGVLFGALLLTKMLAPYLWGWLADQGVSRSRLVRTGSFCAFLVFLGFFYLSGFWACLLLTFGFSFFWNAVLPLFEVMTLKSLGGQHQRYSLIRLWGSVGFILSVTSLGVLFDWVPLTWLPGVISLLLLALWLATLTTGPSDDVHDAGGVQRSIGDLLRRGEVLAFFLVCFLLQVSHGPYYAFYTIYLDQLGYERFAAGLFWALGVFAEILLFLVMHRLYHRFHWRPIMLVSLLLTALRWLLISQFASQVWVLIFAQLLHAASFGAMHAVCIHLIHQIFGSGQEGRGQALYSVISFGAGGAAGTLISGYWVEVAGIAPAFLMAGVLAVIAGLVAWRWCRAL